MKLLIDTEWADFAADLTPTQQLELFWAIFDYSNRECSLNCWKKIQPHLEKGQIAYFNRLKSLKQNKSVTDTDTDSSRPRHGDRDGDRDIVLDNTKVIDKGKGGMGEKGKDPTLKPPTLEQFLKYASEQNAMAGMGGFACSPETATACWSHYQSQGWRKSNESNTPVRDWPVVLRLWCTRPGKFPTAAPAPKSKTDIADDAEQLDNFQKQWGM